MRSAYRYIGLLAGISVVAIAGSLFRVNQHSNAKFETSNTITSNLSDQSMPMMATVLTMGDIMFTGYQSDNPDEFSFVLLTDIMAGTTLTFTDNGWLSAGGFRAGEGTLTVTFVNDFTCGTSLVVSNQGGSWTVSSSSGAIATVVSAGSFQLSTSGDQIFAYQGTAPTGVDQSHFVAAIQMNGTWDSNATNENTSAQPSVFSMSGLGLAISPERDNAQYDCSTISGSPTDLRAAIITTPNWDSDNSNVFDLGDFCDFCCGSGPPVTAPSQVEVNQMFNLDIGITPPTGVWELYGSAGCGVGAPLQTTTGTSFTVTAPASAGIATYYIKESTEDCCTPIDICVVNPDPSVICTDCNSDPLVCGDCFLPAPTDNPDLTATCDDLQMVFILDESGSIGNSGATNDVRDGVLAFMNALNGSGVEMAIIEFNATSRLVTNYQLINNALIASVTGYFNGVPFNGQTYSPSGNTNWHDAINDADNLAIQPDLLIFFTDGEPTAYGTTSSTNCSGNASVVNPVKIANKMKNEGTHMFMLGVGTGINSTNLQAMSGPTQYMNGVNSIGTSDWTIENFSTLAQCLEDFAYELCATSLSLQKTVINSSCDVVTFQFVVRNLGVSNVATSVVVKDTFPAGFASVMHSGPETVCIGNACAPMQPANTFCWTVGDLPPLTSDTLQITVTALTSGSKINTAWATSSTADTVSSTYDASGITTDNTNPVITCPANITVQCTQSTLPAVTGTATATDDQDPTPTITYSDVTAGTAPCITITRTWVATDDCDNSASCVQTITVEDNTPPTINCPANLTLNCGADTSAAATGMATASDNCMPSPTVTRSNQVTPGPCANTFSIQRTWRAVDACGNTNTCVQSIIVQDTTRPTIVCPANVTLYCPADTSAGANGMATGMDNCNNPVSVSHSNQIIPGSCPANYTINRTWRTIDACGNSNSCVQMIQVLDTTRPVINCPAPVTVFCPNDTSVASTGVATGTDVCSSPVLISRTTQITPGSCPANYTITRTWRATDACLNSNTCVQVIQVLDTTRPVITCPPNVTMNCPGDTSVANTGTPISSDLCSTVSVSHMNQVMNGCSGTSTTIRTWIATDACGNSNSCVQIIVVQDTTPPVLPIPPFDTTVNCPFNVPFPGPLVAMDACAGQIIAFPFDRSVPSCDYTITRTWRFMDPCGNVDSVQQFIRVVDSIRPYFTSIVPNDTIYFSCNDTLPTVLPDGEDNCGSVSAEYIDVTLPSPCPANPNVRRIMRTYTITDLCGNDSIYVNWLFFVDTTPPVLTPARDSIVECDGAGNTADYNDWIALHGRATATDDCGPVTWSHQVISSTPLCGATREDSVIFIATDLCGYADTTGAKFIIIDITPPTITPAMPITIDCAAGPTALTNWLNNHGGATASDDCSAITWSSNFGSAPDACGVNNSIPVTFYASDACGNIDSTTADLTIQDDTPPMITVPAMDTIVQCDGAGNVDDYNRWIMNHGGAEATDDCGGVNWINAVITSTPMCGSTRTDSIRFTAVDACGNSAVTTAKFIIIDDVPPVLTPGSNQTVECDGSGNIAAYQNWINTHAGGTATDICSSVTWDTMTLARIQVCGNTYRDSVRFYAIDACGNRDSFSAVFAIRDLTPPMVTPGNNQIVECDGAGNVAEFSSWIDSHAGGAATDVCNVVSWDTTTLARIPMCGNTYRDSVRFYAIDACGNQDSFTAVFIIRDQTPPMVTPGMDIMIDCGGGQQMELQNWLDTHAGGNATDLCGNVTWTNNFGGAPNACSGNSSVPVTFYATDDCNNVDSFTVNLTIQDDIPPTINPPARDTMVQCEGGLTTSYMDWLNNHGGAMASDDCGAVTWAYTEITNAPGCGLTRAYDVRFYAIDACGNRDSTDATFTYIDTVAPILPPTPNDTLVGCPLSVPLPMVLTATDACSGSPITVVPRRISETPSCEYSIIERWIFMDACGNKDSVERMIHVKDSLPPVFTTLVRDDSIYYDCTDTLPTILPGATDACGSVSVEYMDMYLPNSCPSETIIKRTYRATDFCGNADSVINYLIFRDRTAPVLTPARDTIVNCDGAGNVAAFAEWINLHGRATASDNCGMITWDTMTISRTLLCAVTRIDSMLFIVQDDCGNADTTSANFIIRDVTPPVVTPANDTAIDCSVVGGIAGWLAINGGATATEECSTVTWSNNYGSAPGGCGEAPVLVTFYATDACGNVDSTTAMLMIQDTVPPTITAPARDTTVQCEGGATTAYSAWVNNHGGAMGTDDCGPISWDTTELSNTPLCGVTESYVVRFYAVDVCGNRDSTDATFTYIDTVAPVPPIPPANTLVACATDVPAAVSLMATDACQGSVPGVLTRILNDTSCVNGKTITYQWVFTDACDNSSAVTQTIVVKDSIAPVISGVMDGAMYTVNCQDPIPVFTVTASDNCGYYRLTVMDNISGGNCSAESTIVRTWVARDTCGNTSTVSVTIAVVDTIAPTIQAPADTIVYCTSDTSVMNLGDAVAMDNCGMPNLVHHNELIAGSCPQEYMIRRIWTATDACSHVAMDTQLIQVVDTVAPMLVTPPIDTTIECNEMTMSLLQSFLDRHGNATATDECGGMVSWRYRYMVVPDACDPSGSNTFPVTFIYMDECGNEDSVMSMITIVDTRPPTITVEAMDTVVNCDGNMNVGDFDAWIANNGGAEATDDCGVINWRYEIVGTLDLCAATRVDTVRFIASDLCSNADTTMALFTVIDTTPPMIFIRDTTILCDQDTSVGNLGGPTVVEDCGTYTLMHTDVVQEGSCPQEETILRTWVAVDECNNSNTVLQTIDVVDTIPPQVTCPPTSYASCTADEIPIITSWSQFMDSLGTATDNCNLDTTTFRYVTFRTVVQPTRRLVYREYEIGDGCGNFGSCEHLIIVQDVTPPDARCVDTFRIMANDNGIATILVDSIDNGSTDNCGIDSMWLDRANFNCDFFYNVTLVRRVTLYVRDYAGNVSTCETVLLVTCPCPPSPLPPTCNDEITVSLGSNCSFEVDASVIMQNYIEGCDDPYKITLTTSSNVKIGSLITENEMGQDLTYNIIDTTNGNRCWGVIHVEDKRPPQIICEDHTVSCIEPIPELPQVEENCSFVPKLDLLEEVWTDYNCSENTELSGVMHRKVRATDAWGNYRECEQDIYVRRESLDDLHCPADTILECCTKDIEGKYKLWDTTLVTIDAAGIPHPKPLVKEGRVAGLVDVPYLVVDGDTTYVWDIHHGCNIIVDYQDDVIGLCEPTYMIRRNWIIKDWCRGTEIHCTQLIKVVDNTPPVVKQPAPVTVAVTAHDCKAAVVIARPEITEECAYKFYKNNAEKAESLIQVTYSVTYTAEKGKTVTLEGELGVGKEEHLYLPAGDYNIHYYVTDGCWNQREIIQAVWVLDDVAPIPVCDEITQVTLDPDSCWARIYAKDLDDGSYDGCCETLHFAVATMNEISYWRTYWREQLNACNPELYHYDTLARNELIEHWIDCYIFNDYADITACKEEQVVLRVYEACGMPQYDPHVFKGTEHDWYCWNLYNDFACYYRLNYDSVSHYQRLRPDLCDSDYTTACIGVASLSPGVPHRNPLCCSYPTEALLERWAEVQQKYPEVVELSASRWWFPHLSSDCMIQVRKDDKEAPVVEAPEDITVYCDGVPYWVEVPFKLGEAGNYVLHAPGYAWNVCSPWGDYLTTGSCPESGWYDDEVGGRCCLELPWDGGKYGYYQGPKFDYYGADSCGYNLWQPERALKDAHASWMPTYCMLWLWLDKYDQPGGGKVKVEGGEPVITDNCTPLEELYIDYKEEGGLNECGVGTLTRSWTVEDGCGNSSTAHQSIHVLPRSDFEVIFPADVTVTCEEPGSLEAELNGAGAPLITDDDCELIGIHYEDEIYEVSGAGCYQIQRTWKVIDWCVFNADQNLHHPAYPDVIVDDRVYAGSDRKCVYRYLKDNGDGYMLYTQLIDVIDEVSPAISCISDTVLCTYNATCGADSVVLLLGTAVDNCTDSASISYRYSVREVDEPVALIYGSGRVLHEMLAYGTYEVSLIAEDLCGNADTCYTQLTIRDCKAPTPYCYDGIVTVIMEIGGSITVWASDLDAGSYDNCTAAEDLVFSFTEDGETPSRTYICEDIPNGKENVFKVDMWVIDADGNRDHCTVDLRIQDNTGDACSDISSPLQTVEGTIQTEQGTGVEYVEVKVPQMTSVMTDVSGKYTVEGMDENGQYELNPFRNDRVLNGVSTLDLLKIQKHLLGIEMLETPYQLIAADINNSKSLTAIDLLDLRKVILGILDSFPNNHSWRFVDKHYAFPEPGEPWTFPEQVKVEPSTYTGNPDFIGIKVGDVNGSSQPNGLAGAEIREDQTYWLRVEDRKVMKGESVVVPVYAEGNRPMEGWQWTLEALHARVEEVYSDVIGLKPENIGYKWSKEGVVTMSWNAVQPVTVGEESPLFYVRIEAGEEGWLSDVLRIHSRYTPAEAYGVNDEVLGVGLKYRRGGDVLTQAMPKLYQNTPNPFNEQTKIGFELPETSDIVLTIMDISGRMVKQIRGNYGRGYHEIEVKAEELERSGVLHYQLQTKDYVQVRKMILIK
ncbi:MAG: VWA domain-containing protein [Lewinellaceae bacterium]|nr:VWA domain-containing protein [Lewinellaceae bacterium]